MRICAVMLASLAILFAAEKKLGKPLTLAEPTAIDKILASPEKYEGQVIQVKGSVRDLCREMGCWMEIAAPSGKSIRIKVEDGVIVFPKESIGKTAIAEGKLVKVALTKEQAIAQARHEAEVNGRKFDPSSIKSGVAFYQIEGTGATILD